MHNPLTAQPEGQLSGQRRVQDVQLLLSEQQKTINLTCDFVPGALRQSYTAVWQQVSTGSRHVIQDVTFHPTFDLMLNVTRSMNNFQYQCEVKIKHNSSISRLYNGTLNVLSKY